MEADTASYTKPAISFVENGSFGEISLRTPGYPLFLAAIYSIVKSNIAVVVVQHILGLILIGLILQMASSTKIKIAVLLFFLADANIIRYEHSILADFLLAFSLCVSIYFLTAYFQKLKNKFLIFSGIFLAAGVVTKPVLKFCPYLFALFLLFFLLKQKIKAKEIAKKIFLLVFPALILWFSWSAHNCKKTEYFGLTPFLGIELGGITESFWNFSSPLHKDIKEVYKKHLLSKKSKRESVVHAAVAELSQKRPMFEINEILFEIAKESILTNPHKYLMRGIRETIFFYFSNDSIFASFSHDLQHGSMLRQFKEQGLSFQVLSKILLRFYLIWWFVLFGFFIYIFKKLKNPKQANISDWAILFTILYIGGVSAFVSFGFPRFRIAIQVFIILWSATAWVELAEKLKISLPFARKKQPLDFSEKPSDIISDYKEHGRE